MHELGLKLSRLLHAGDLVVLTGPLGAGKTTLTRGVGEGLTAIGNVSSPTFVIARTHRRRDGGPVLVHVDRGHGRAEQRHADVPRYPLGLAA